MKTYKVSFTDDTGFSDGNKLKIEANTPKEAYQQFISKQHENQQSVWVEWGITSYENFENHLKTDKEIRNNHIENLKSLRVQLDKSISNGMTYVELNNELRKTFENGFMVILRKNLDDWTEEEKALYKAVLAVPGRSQYLNILYDLSIGCQPVEKKVRGGMNTLMMAKMLAGELVDEE